MTDYQQEAGLLMQAGSRYLQEGESASRTDLETSAFTQATAYLVMSLIKEVTHLVQVVEELRDK